MSRSRSPGGRRRRGEGDSSPNYPPGFGVIWTTVALDLVGFGIIIPILPLYAERFGASPTQIGFLLSSYSLSQFLFAPLLGRLSDRIGRKPVLILSLVGTALGSLMTGLAGSLWMLFAGRIVDGASGASIAVAQAAVGDIADARDRPRLIGILSAAFGVGFVAGPALGALAALQGPALPFLVAAALAGANAVAAMVRLPETRSRERIDEVRTKARHALTPQVRRLIAVSFVALLGFSGFEATFALFGERRLGFTESSVAAAFVGVGLLLVFVQVRLVGPVVDRLGPVGAVRAGIALNVAGFLLLAPADSWAALVVALALLTVGQGLLTPSLTSLVSGQSGDHRGAVLGVQQSAGAAARVAGPLLGGLLFEHLGIGAPYLMAAGLALVALLLLPRTRHLAVES